MLKHDEEKKTVRNARIQGELIAFVLPNEMEYTLRLLFPRKYAILDIFLEAPFFHMSSLTNHFWFSQKSVDIEKTSES